ncbi:unnamed protein product [Rhizophagus irregularis]|uniref:Uncharacterized protein n=1 Tax=Rhizophagus irregularis TaxID=588596 RepID=A0A916E1K5_9GLOM|nr:unnamed protein product [Rhizophagus irregularis]
MWSEYIESMERKIFNNSQYNRCNKFFLNLYCIYAKIVETIYDYDKTTNTVESDFQLSDNDSMNKFEKELLELGEN